MRDTLILLSILGFVCGIGIGSFVTIGLPQLLFGTLVATSILLCYLYSKARIYLSIFILLVGVLVGAFRISIVPTDIPPSVQRYIDTEISEEGVVVADPDVRETSQRLTIQTSIDGIETKVLAVASTFPPVTYGDRVQVSGVLMRPEAFDTDTGRSFAYDKFLAKDGIFLLIQRAHIDMVGTEGDIWYQVRRMLSVTKFRFIDALGAALPEPHASLAAGLLAGGKQGLGDEWLAVFIGAGLIHIVVLSGYNVMIVAESVLRAFHLAGRRAAAILAAVVITLFVLAAGAGPASIRAGIMAGLTLLARATGRTYVVMRALLVSLVCMLLYSPLLLIFDPGFQLSFIATLGLIYGVPIVEKWFAVVKVESVREILSSTVSAQIAVLPLLLYQTGTLSIVALPVNMLVLPIIPVAMLLSFVAGMVGLVSITLAPIVGAPAYFSLAYVLFVAEKATLIPYATVSIPPFPFWIVVVSYGVLVYGVYRKRSGIEIPERFLLPKN